MKAIRMKTAELYEPIGIDVRHPRFSWNCAGGKKQTAYQVSVTDETGAVLFDSGKTASDSMHCIYAGLPLKSRQRALWQVCLWDENGDAQWSQTAGFEMGLLDGTDWAAKWITGIDTDREERLSADCYRKNVLIQGNVKCARLYASALGVYSARINGKQVGNVLAPGTTQYDCTLYYQTYDVTEFLQSGENVLEFTVADGWYKGKLGSDQREYVYGTQTKLLAQLEVEFSDGEKLTVGTDNSFDWCSNGPVRFSDLKDGVIYDARMTPDYREKALEATAENIVPTASNAPAIAEHEVFRPKLEISPSGAKILNFGQNLAGYVRFRTDAPEGTVIRLRLFEATDHGEYSDASLSFPNGDVQVVKQEIVYTCSGRNEWYQPAFFYSGFQYALVEGLDAVDPENFEAVAVYSDLEFGSWFECSNETVNRFVNNTRWSMKSNFVDVPTDCPQREKSGWTGDAQVFCRTASYFADTTAFFRKWLKDVRDCQRPDGMVVDVNPKCGNETDPRRGMVNGACGWSDAAVIIPHTLWKMTGDDSVIRDNLPLMLDWAKHRMALCEDKSMFELPDDHPMASLRQIYRMFRLQDSPLNRFIPESGVHWGEWCVPESQEPSGGDEIFELLRPKQEVTCAYTHYSMKRLSEMLEAVGQPEAAARYREFAEGAKAAYQFHWVREGTIHTQRMAELVRPIALGLLTEDQERSVCQKLNEMVISRNYKVGTGFLSTPFVLQVLAGHGYVQTAYRMMENTEAPGWLAMVKQGATTVWEQYECYDAQGHPKAHSFNHYSPGSMCSFLFDTVCGIRVVGENRLCIAPLPGGTLRHASAGVQTAYGMVKSGWTRENGRICYQISVPANVCATVRLPDGSCVQVDAGEYTFEGHE